MTRQKRIQIHQTVVAILFSLAINSHARAEELMVGMLEIRKLAVKFRSDDAKNAFRPTPVTVFAAPDVKSASFTVKDIASIKTWPLENGWELAQVFEVKGGFFRILVNGEAKWIPKSEAGAYKTYFAVLKSQAALLEVSGPTVAIYDSPGGKSLLVDVSDKYSQDNGRQVSLLEEKVWNGQIWYRIDLKGPSCAAPRSWDKKVYSGWVPLILNGKYSFIPSNPC